VVAWCDRHLMAMNILIVLAADQPGVVAEALVDALDRRTPAGVRSPSHNFFGARCPGTTASSDRVEEALHLLGEHTGADIASAFGLAEPTVLRQLHHTLRMLSAPCEGTESWAQPPRRIRARRAAVVGAVRRGGAPVVPAAVPAGVAAPGEGGRPG
jgi:hypothetical protein